jgi:hypothetical protein
MIRRLPEFHARVRQIDNRAVFEVTDILATLLQSASSPASARAVSLATADAVA